MDSMHPFPPEIRDELDRQDAERCRQPKAHGMRVELAPRPSGAAELPDNKKEAVAAGLLDLSKRQAARRASLSDMSSSSAKQQEQQQQEDMATQAFRVALNPQLAATAMKRGAQFRPCSARPHRHTCCG